MTRRTIPDMLVLIPMRAAEAVLTMYAPNPSERAERTRGTKRAHPPLPIPADAIDVLRPLKAEIVECSRIVWESLPADTRPGLHERLVDDDERKAVTAECDWMLSVWGEASTYLDLADFDWIEDTLSHHLRRLERICRVPQAVRLKCLVDGCGGAIYPTVEEREDGSKRIYAEACEYGHQIDRHEALRRALRMTDMPISELSDRLGVPVSTLHRWAKLRLIQPVRRANGVKLFNYEAVYRVHLRTVEGKLKGA